MVEAARHDSSGSPPVHAAPGTAPLGCRPIRLLLVDHEVLFTDLLGRLLAAESDFALIGAASSGEEALKIAASDPPMVALVALDLPGIDGLATTHGLKALCPEIGVVVVSHSEEFGVVTRALDVGASGFVHKWQAADELFAMIRAVADGLVTLEDRRRMTGDVGMTPCGASTDDRRKPHIRLTPRETEVLRLASTGLSNRQIADALFLSDHTVLGYLKNVFTKLGVHSKLQAVMLGISEGLIPMPAIVPSDDDEPTPSGSVGR